MPHEDIANRAKEVFNKLSSINVLDTREIDTEWHRIRAALVGIGIDASLLRN